MKDSVVSWIKDRIKDYRKKQHTFWYDLAKWSWNKPIYVALPIAIILIPLMAIETCFLVFLIVVWYIVASIWYIVASIIIFVSERGKA